MRVNLSHRRSSSPHIIATQASTEALLRAPTLPAELPGRERQVMTLSAFASEGIRTNRFENIRYIYPIVVAALLRFSRTELSFVRNIFVRPTCHTTSLIYKVGAGTEYDVFQRHASL